MFIASCGSDDDSGSDDTAAPADSVADTATDTMVTDETTGGGALEGGEGEVSIIAWAGYIERGEICPLVAATFPLERIADAQREFLLKRHVGKFVLIPPAEA